MPGPNGTVDCGVSSRTQRDGTGEHGAYTLALDEASANRVRRCVSTPYLFALVAIVHLSVPETRALPVL
jgi:hypothetical protein